MFQLQYSQDKYFLIISFFCDNKTWTAKTLIISQDVYAFGYVAGWNRRDWQKTTATQPQAEHLQTSSACSINNQLGSSNDGKWHHDLFNRRNQRPANRQSQKITFNARANSNSIALAISNLHYEVSEADLYVITVANQQELFDEAGHVAIEFDRSGRSKGAAKVSFPDRESAQKAQQKFDGFVLSGQQLQVEFQPQTRKPAREHP